MALSALTVLEVRRTGSDTNGGGFVTGAAGTDWSQQDSPQYSVTDGVATGNTVVSSASAAFGTDVVGNLVYLQGGTGSLVAGWYQITARTSGSITLDRNVAAGTGITLKIGGALASPGQAGAIATVSGMRTYIKYNASPYVATSASTNIAGGCVLGTAGTFWIGYDTVRTLYQLPSNRPTFQLNAGVSTAVLFTGTAANYALQSVILDCNNQTASRAGLMSGEYFNVKAMNGKWNAAGGVIQDNSAGRAILVEVSNCTLTSTANALKMNGSAYFCWTHDNTVATVNHALVAVNAIGCLSYKNLGGGGFGSIAMALNCVSYGNAQHGFFPYNIGGTYMNCIAESNGTLGWFGGTSRYTLINSASYLNGTARSSVTTGAVFDIGAILGTGSFFTNAAAADFSLNNIAGRGALCRETGFPNTFPV